MDKITTVKYSLSIASEDGNVILLSWDDLPSMGRFQVGDHLYACHLQPMGADTDDRYVVSDAVYSLVNHGDYLEIGLTLRVRRESTSVGRSTEHK